VNYGFFFVFTLEKEWEIREGARGVKWMASFTFFTNSHLLVTNSLLIQTNSLLILTNSLLLSALKHVNTKKEGAKKASS
jgi:hypothetical protein